MNISPDLLHEALEGRSLLGPGQGEVTELVRLAGTILRLQPEGPSPAAVARMTTRFENMLERPRRRWLFALLGPWIGIGAAPRPLVQRLAAGALLVASVGGGASVASGVDPARAVGGTVDFITNAIANLSPRGDSGGISLPPVTGTPSPAATPTPGTTPAPAQTPPAQTGSSPAATSAVNQGAPPVANTEPPSTSTPTPSPTPGVILPAPGTPAAVTPTATATATTPTPTAPTATTTPQGPVSTTTATPPTSTQQPSPSPTARVTATETPKNDDGGEDH